MYNDEFNNNDMYRFTNREVPRDDYAPAPRQENTYTAPVRKQGFFRRTWVKVTALVLACAVVGGAAGYGGAALAGGSTSGGKTTINESDRTATAVQIKKVIKELERAKRPIICAGGGVLLSEAEEELRNARENLEIVKDGISSRFKELSNTQIRSTITGMILDVPIKVGNSVIQANTFNDGTTIATVADMSNMLFRGNIDETDVGKLHEGMPVKLTIGALQNVELDALLEYVSPKATEENGVIMFEVKAAATIPDSIFVRAGYSANASIVIQRRAGVLTLPESTVEFEGDKTYVQVLTSPAEAEEQTFERREVKIGLSDGINIEITEGVTADDQIRGAREEKK